MPTTQKGRLLREPVPFEELQTKEAVRRLNAQFMDMVKKINDLHFVKAMPLPTNFESYSSPTKKPGFVILSWDDIPDELRTSVDGMRIYRAYADDDGETDFYKNTAIETIDYCRRSTTYRDLDDRGTEDRIYWIRWVNKKGELGPVAGGISGTIFL